MKEDSVLNITIDRSQVRNLLNVIQGRLKNLTPAYSLIGEIVKASVLENFAKSGRPDRWVSHSAATIARRGFGAKILVDRGFNGGLAGSIQYKADGDKVSIGTNKIYGPVHQYGAAKGSFGMFTIRVREHFRKGFKIKGHSRKMNLPWGDIPARPFLMVQDNDWVDIKAALANYVIGA